MREGAPDSLFGEEDGETIKLNPFLWSYESPRRLPCGGGGFVKLSTRNEKIVRFSTWDSVVFPYCG